MNASSVAPVSPRPPPPPANPTLAAAAAAQRDWPATGKWHAHLSALSGPAASERRRRLADKKAAVGTSLDRRVLDTPLMFSSAFAPEQRRVLSCSDCGDDYVDLFERDDGSGRQRWLVSDVAGSPGEYTLLGFGGRDGCVDESGVQGSCWFLSAFERGAEVNMWHEDDASGRQRWVFKQTGDSQYQIRVAGGKADDKVYLGVGDDGVSVRLFSKASARTAWNLAVIPYCDEVPPEAPDAPAVATHVPRAAVQALGGTFSERQIDTVLQLISLPENGMPDWYKNYGFIEFLGDGRGFTATIFGACSGTGDLAMVFDALADVSPRSEACDELLTYRDKLKRKRGDDIRGIEGIKGIIRGLGDDPAWQEAVWRVYVKLYWQFAGDWAAKTGGAADRPGPVLTTAAGRGFMVDTAINHGADVESFQPILDRMDDPETEDESSWLTDFARARQDMLRSGYDDLDTSRTGDRCDLWMDLFDGNPDLATPFKAYKGYWGDYTIQ